MKKPKKKPGAAKSILKGVKVDPTLSDDESRDDALNKLHGSVTHYDASDLIDRITEDNQPSSWDSFFEDALPADADFCADREAVFDPDKRSFDTEAAMARWLKTPNRTLEGLTPAEAIRTEEGRARVVELLQQMADR